MSISQGPCIFQTLLSSDMEVLRTFQESADHQAEGDGTCASIWKDISRLLKGFDFYFYDRRGNREMAEIIINSLSLIWGNIMF